MLRVTWMVSGLRLQPERELLRDCVSPLSCGPSTVPGALQAVNKYENEIGTKSLCVCVRECVRVCECRRVCVCVWHTLRVCTLLESTLIVWVRSLQTQRHY